jgi:hypothetical protein
MRDGGCQRRGVGRRARLAGCCAGDPEVDHESQQGHDDEDDDEGDDDGDDPSVVVAGGPR